MKQRIRSIQFCICSPSARRIMHRDLLAVQVVNQVVVDARESFADVFDAWVAVI